MNQLKPPLPLFPASLKYWEPIYPKLAWCYRTRKDRVEALSSTLADRGMYSCELHASETIKVIPLCRGSRFSSTVI
jgi:hypothetical protein